MKKFVKIQRFLTTFISRENLQFSLVKKKLVKMQPFRAVIDCFHFTRKIVDIRPGNLSDFLLQMGFTDNEGKPGNFAEQYNSRREMHLSSLQQKEEEMRQKFVIRVKEKEAELKEAEKEV